MLKRRKTKWHKFYPESKYDIMVGRCDVISLEGRLIRDDVSTPGKPVYLGALLFMSREGISPAGRVVVVIDVHNNKWAYVSGGLIVSWPPWHRLTHKHRDGILAAAAAQMDSPCSSDGLFT